ncbi:unnamed protein product [Pleuronectes platessa]|uniref:Uncharacterized protein n=1 Tax=Pleuronectes platessa TaxID=8262 RepID=A0A9N7U6Z1_PLEPL|nr:unnamed protein product [Pleuronectes platessa]
MISISNHKARISTNPKEEEEVGHQEEEEVGHQEAEDVAQETPRFPAITVDNQGILPDTAGWDPSKWGPHMVEAMTNPEDHLTNHPLRDKPTSLTQSHMMWTQPPRPP